MSWDSDFRLPERGLFDDLQRSQLRVLFGALHPADHARGVPGADQASAVRFLDLLLAADSAAKYYEIAEWRAAYPQWLKALDAQATAAFNSPLAALNLAQATVLLERLEAGKLEGVTDQPKIFQTLWRHCLQGCWSDPRWGGNADQVMWRWIGYLQEPENVTVKAAEHGND